MDIDYKELLKDPDLTTSIRLRIYGVMYEKEGKLEEAYQAYLSEVEKGNAEAMFFIGNLYFFHVAKLSPMAEAVRFSKRCSVAGS